MEEGTPFLSLFLHFFTPSALTPTSEPLNTSSGPHRSASVRISPSPLFPNFPHNFLCLHTIYLGGHLAVPGQVPGPATVLSPLSSSTSRSDDQFIANPLSRRPPCSPGNPMLVPLLGQDSFVWLVLDARSWKFRSSPGTSTLSHVNEAAAPPMLQLGAHESLVAPWFAPRPLTSPAMVTLMTILFQVTADLGHSVASDSPDLHFASSLGFPIRPLRAPAHLDPAVALSTIPPRE